MPLAIPLATASRRSQMKSPGGETGAFVNVVAAPKGLFGNDKFSMHRMAEHILRQIKLCRAIISYKKNALPATPGARNWDF
jgi:hypothetical protein